MTLAGQAPAGQPTPGPWRTSIGNVLLRDVAYIIRDGRKRIVAKTLWNSCTDHDYPGSAEEAEANAALIVRAVNCHAELVEALRDLVAHQEYLLAYGESQINPLTFQRAADALSRATGSQP